MPRTRAFRSLVCRLMAGLMLLSQFAIAGYACPLPAPVAAGTAAHCASATLDVTQKSLCFEHCHPSSQSTDTPSPPAPAPALAAVLYVVPALDASTPPADVLVAPGPDGPSLEVASAPPHAILHCVWRT
jgi:hypothetical protein